jgi:hypothetical protein
MGLLGLLVLTPDVSVGKLLDKSPRWLRAGGFSAAVGTQHQNLLNCISIALINVTTQPWADAHVWINKCRYVIVPFEIVISYEARSVFLMFLAFYCWHRISLVLLRPAWLS